ncbi:hypothetical protein K3495_g14732 [Podosphaera aphanis]|nr:hypothetical protein K3495_g14732 [Podosphaera aphanis]
MIGWRTTISEASKDPTKVWKVAKRAKKDEEEKRRLPQIPDIKDAEGKIHTESPDKDIEGFTYPEELKTIPNVITQQEIEEALRKLPNDKAPGPDDISNRLLKNCSKTLSKVLAELFNACLRLGYHPNKFKEPTTIVTRKPQKPSYDTPKSYRPIALLNKMGKLLEILVANRILDAAEKYNLLPDEQMGARPKRSSISAVELLPEQIHTIWGKSKKRVASLLSLNVSGAFDNVSHERLIYFLRQKGIPLWITQFIKSFLDGRTTSIVLGSFKGGQIPTITGIPQGFPVDLQTCRPVNLIKDSNICTRPT